MINSHQMETKIPHWAGSGFKRVFMPGKLTIGIMFPIESFVGANPSMQNQVELVQLAESYGFAAAWFRDVPLLDPSFGDVGQIYDVWVYMSYILVQTSQIALITGSVVLPLRHPLHTAKAAASIDNLSGGRLVLGVASGDRPVEFPAFGKDISERDEEFRLAWEVITRSLEDRFPEINTRYGHLANADLVPKPLHGHIPMMVTGHSRQSLEWIAKNSDGWIMYPRDPGTQHLVIDSWQKAVSSYAPRIFKPFAQSLYIDLAENPDEPIIPIHLGYHLGTNGLKTLLQSLQSIGVNHVTLNLKYGRRRAMDVLHQLGDEILPYFPANDT
jgi:luciferase-type oxidoreductase